ncbi:hypothetical protein MKEN_00309000 [Mycena kentingensis (nom. inval.)]|nr:hypothetical protein MKEN_00309000 [Mycena kentingensis (nom. inval.)]
MDSSAAAYAAVLKGHVASQKALLKDARELQPQLDKLVDQANDTTDQFAASVKDLETALAEEEAFDAALDEEYEKELAQWMKLKLELAQHADLLASKAYAELGSSLESGMHVQNARGGDQSRRRREATTAGKEREYPGGAAYVEGLPTAQEIGSGYPDNLGIHTPSALNIDVSLTLNLVFQRYRDSTANVVLDMQRICPQRADGDDQTTSRLYPSAPPGPPFQYGRALARIVPVGCLALRSLGENGVSTTWTEAEVVSASTGFRSSGFGCFPGATMTEDSRMEREGHSETGRCRSETERGARFAFEPGAHDHRDGDGQTTSTCDPSAPPGPPVQYGSALARSIFVGCLVL